MIPKVIHYCWFGRNPIPEKFLNYMESWKKYCPDYEIIRWDEDNYRIEDKPLYVRQAYEAKKWAFVSDYARLDILYHEGGVYFDTDVELIRNIDQLLDNKGFCGFEKGETNVCIGLGLGMGAEKNNPILLDLMGAYKDKQLILSDGSIDMTPINFYTESVLLPKGIKLIDKTQEIEGMKVYSSRYFGLGDVWTGGAKSLTKDTYSIHHYGSSWWSDYNKSQLDRKRKIYKKYGKRRFDSGRAFVIEAFWDDVRSVQEENGMLRSIVYFIVHAYPAYFGKME